MQKKLQRFRIRFNRFRRNKVPRNAEEVKTMNIVFGEDGSAYIEGEHPVVLRTRDGYCLYAARDLATINFRSATYSPDVVIYVVGEEQSTSFSAVFNAAEKLGLNENNSGKTKLEHAPFGLLLDANGKKLSTRKGTSGKLMDIIEELDNKAYVEIQKRNPELSDEEARRNAEILSMSTTVRLPWSMGY